MYRPSGDHTGLSMASGRSHSVRTSPGPPTGTTCSVAAVESGELTRFLETELWETTRIFGNVAHRFSAYAKSGVSKGEPFQARGMISTQFIHTPAGWRISAMAWDDERPGLTLPPREP